MARTCVRMQRTPATTVAVLALALALLTSLLAPGMLTRTLVVKAKPGSGLNLNTWVTDGTVSAVATTPTATYIGGGFTYVGPNTGNGAPVDMNTGEPLALYPRVDGRIYACVSDGSGGWYIGGSFTKVDSVFRNGIARILPDGTLDRGWNPNPNDDINALAFSGSTVYAGGDFTSIGGTERNHVAALDAETGEVADWNPDASNDVYALAVSGSTVYAGGLFSSIGGQPRDRIAAIHAETGEATGWNPDSDSWVEALVVSNSTVYAGGDFTSIGGQPRSRIAAIDAETGAATGWDPNANDYVLALAVSGDTVFAGGGFTSIGGQPRRNIAAIDAETGAATGWDPNANRSVYTLTVSNSTVYAGGGFTSIGGQPRSNIAAIDAETGAATGWNPGTNGWVHALAISGSTVYAGGRFSSIGGKPRRNIAAFDAETGAATGWNPGANGWVFALAVSGSTVYAGGAFTTMGGEGRNRLAAIGTDGALREWNPGANLLVLALAVSGDIVYAGGYFTSVNGQSRSHIAAINAVTGAATDWDPDPDDNVLTLAVSGSTVYAGGSFTTIGGEDRNRLAAIGTDGTLRDWDPDPDDDVSALAVSGSTVYAGGDFTSIGGKGRSCLAAIGTDGTLRDWDPDPDDDVLTLAVSGSTVFAGGYFSSIGGKPKNHIAALDVETGAATGWDPDANSLVNALVVSGSTVYAGGSFASIGGVSCNGFAQFDQAAPIPEIISANPTSGRRGDTLNVMITGADTCFVQGVSVATFSGEGINVNSTTVTNSTIATANITIASDALLGTRDVNVITAGETPVPLAGGFAVAASPPPAGEIWYLAEGTNAWGFSTYITIENPNNEAVRARLTYMDPNPTSSGKGIVGTNTVTLPPLSQTTISSYDDIGEVDFSTKVECLEGKSIAVDRTMYWTGSGASCPEAHNSVGVTSPSKIWYLPEGSSNHGFETWTLVQNPNDTEANLTLTYMTEDAGAIPVEKKVPANSRATYNMASDIGVHDSSIQVTSSVPLIAERSQYRNDRREGACSIGATAPSTDFFLAEGTTAWGFTTYVLVQNPNDSESQVAITYMTPSGPLDQAPFTMRPNSRRTIKVNDIPGVSNTDLSTRLHSDRPIIAERAMYWTCPTDSAQVCHDSIGLSSPHMTFLLPDGQTTEGWETWALVANPNPLSVSIRVTYLPQNGGDTVTFTYEIPADSRRTYNMAGGKDAYPGFQGRASILVESLDGARPIMAERAMYRYDRGCGTDTVGGFEN